jgi:hypothetical protein
MENLVITITTHGIIPTYKTNIGDYKPITKTLDKPINIYKLNAVDIGVPNVSTLKTTERLCNKLYDIINKNKDMSTSLLIEHLKNSITDISNKLVKIIKHDAKNFKSLQQYMHRLDSRFKIEHYTHNSKYIDKEFYLFDDNSFNKKVFYTNAITLLNLENTNLFELIESLIENITQISMSQLIDFITNFIDVKNIIIIDLSCSTTDLDERSMRRLRRNIVKDIQNQNIKI